MNQQDLTITNYDNLLENLINATPEEDEKRKAQKRYNYHIIQMPLMRLILFSLLTFLLFYYNRFALNLFSWDPIIKFAAISLGYTFVSWLLLFLFFRKAKNITDSSMGWGFFIVELLMVNIFIYFSGAETSILFFLVCIRAIDITSMSFKETVLRGHMAAASYFLLVLYLYKVESRSIAWSMESVKFLAIYGSTIYIMLIGKSLELRHKETVTAVRLAKQCVAKLKEQSKLLDQNNSQLLRKNEELVVKNEQLLESNKRADRIFSALADALPGTVLDGKYKLEDKIGAGGFGAVFSGIHLAMKRPIAVKVFKPVPGNDSLENLERFQQEAISASRINHPNAVIILDSGISSEGIPYLVMELLKGYSLKDELRNRKMLSAKRLAKIMIPVCDVLAKAHSSGIIHRDIKPDNIFIHCDEQGEVVKVVDFGIAKFVDSSSDDVKSLTVTGGLIGTPTHMAPERFEGKPYDGKSDVYSVGVMMYEILCGKVPFEVTEGGVMVLMVRHMMQAPKPLREVNPNVSIEIETVVMKALEKNPENRPSAKELALEIANAVGIKLEFRGRSTGSLFAPLDKLIIEDETTAQTVDVEGQTLVVNPSKENVVK